MKLVNLYRGQMMRATPELASSFQASAPRQREGVSHPGYPAHPLASSRPNIRRIFSGTGFRTWNLPAPKTRPYHLATSASLYFRLA
ncbi:hypothetical protein AVEN_95145-1 [Araneus ventricosus]|uniref:Uncharacterized protein n=1 Tax=Araneus ventricosus TaxID=182803 RepID=A0A4Y2MYU2_ARAVE|nr:hypothetical protein AVEN_95145-1 [Araneus ventricosus]